MESCHSNARTRAHLSLRQLDGEVTGHPDVLCKLGKSELLALIDEAEAQVGNLHLASLQDRHRRARSDDSRPHYLQADGRTGADEPSKNQQKIIAHKSCDIESC